MKEYYLFGSVLFFFLICAETFWDHRKTKQVFATPDSLFISGLLYAILTIFWLPIIVGVTMYKAYRFIKDQIDDFVYREYAKEMLDIENESE